MFSTRLEWDLPANPLSRLLEEKRAAGAPVLDLTESNPTAAGLVYPAESIVAALCDSRSLRYEPEPAGLWDARESVSAYYGGRVAPGRIVLTSGTSEAYGFLFKLLADPGDEVLVPRPSYPLFGFLAALESVKVAEYPLVYHGAWSIDLDALERAITPRTRAIVLVNPNNPTGTFLKDFELARLIELCSERRLAIVSDEVFADYGFGEDPRRVRSLVDVAEILTFSLSGLSKVAGLPQLKLAWIVANGPEPLRNQAFQRLELIADTYLSVGTPVQRGAGALLELRGTMRDQILSRVRSNLDELRARIGPESPWRMLHADGGWYAILEAPRIRSEEEWTLQLLAEDGVLVQPGYFYDFEREAYLVVSLLTEPAIFREGVRRVLAHGA